MKNSTLLGIIISGTLGLGLAISAVAAYTDTGIFQDKAPETASSVRTVETSGENKKSEKEDFGEKKKEVVKEESSTSETKESEVVEQTEPDTESSVSEIVAIEEPSNNEVNTSNNEEAKTTTPAVQEEIYVTDIFPQTGEHTYDFVSRGLILIVIGFVLLYRPTKNRRKKNP